MKSSVCEWCFICRIYIYFLTSALEQLRSKWLDLTGRNRLINFKHTPGQLKRNDNEFFQEALQNARESIEKTELSRSQAGIKQLKLGVKCQFRREKYVILKQAPRSSAAD
jgi:hypothetical protein